MKISDRLFGAVFLFLGAAIAAYGMSLPAMVGQAYGAGLFPVVVGAGLAIGGAALTMGGWQRRTTEPLLAISEWGRSRPHLLNFVLIIASLLSFALFIRQAGFSVLTFGTICVLLLRFGQPIWRAFLIALVAAAAFQVLFVSIMRVPLPPGILAGLIY